MLTIGIVMRVEKLDGQYKWFLNESYITALQRYHVAIYPICSYASLRIACSLCDGLIIPGGYDIHAYYLNTIGHSKNTYYDRQMDCFDFACMEAFVTAKKPILGICRGMQIINVYFHGTLIQDIDIDQHAPLHVHDIILPKESTLHLAYPTTFQVNSYHHQRVDSLGENLILSATTLQSEVEAIEHKSLCILGVQWHPELMENDQVIPFFLSRC